MSRAVEIAAAAGAALALHLVALGYVADHVGAAGAGEGGQALASLDAAPLALSALVATWETPPATATLTNIALPEPEAPTPQTAIPAAISAPAPLAPIATLAPPGAADIVASLPEVAVMAPPLESSAPRLAALAPEPAAPGRPAAVPAPDRLTIPQPERPQAPAADAAPSASVTATESATARIAPQTSPLPKPRPSAAQQAQRAAGSGGIGSAGQAGTAAAASADQTGTASAVAAWGAGIRARIEARQHFPTAAIGNGGNVTIGLTVARSGALVAVTVATSSGNPALDAAALAAARAAAPFGPAPTGLGAPNYSFLLGIRFRR